MMSNAAKKPEPAPTRGVPITDPSFVPEYDDEGIIINDPDCPPLSPERLARMRRRPMRDAPALPLASLRKGAGLSQATVAQRADMQQPQVSKLESAGDELQISTLRRYIEALGLELELHAVSPKGGRWKVSI